MVPSVRIGQTTKRVCFDLSNLEPRRTPTPLQRLDRRIVYGIGEQNFDASDRSRHRKQRQRGNYEANNHISYKVSNHASRSERGSLVDRGANGGIVGNDAKVIHTYEHAKVDVTGIDNHELT